MHPTEKELLAAVRDVLPGVDLSEADADTNIRTELCLDSLQVMMLLVVLEESYEMKIEEVAKAQTVGELCRLLVRK